MTNAEYLTTSGLGLRRGAVCFMIPNMSKQATILYTQTGCADSRKVRGWLAERGVLFVERNVTGDLDAATALMATSIFATPLLVVGDEQVFGFRPDKLAAVLASSVQANARIST
jgi:glutaredoxin